MRLAILLAIPAFLAGGGPATADLAVPRAAHTATLLASGEVLVAGGCAVDSCELDERGATTEIVDARGGTRPGPQLLQPRVGHHAAALADGTVLIAGGFTKFSLTPSAELLVGDAFVALPPMKAVRGGATSTRLRDGRVLFVGGSAGPNTLRTAELYVPKLRRFVMTGRLRTARSAHAATLLPDGRVLVAGGSNKGGVLRSAEIYDPRTGRFTPVGSMRTARHKLALAPLPGGALAIGGSDERDWRGRIATAERFDARRGKFVAVARLAVPRFKLADAVVATPAGIVVAGGAPSVELYEPRTGRFRTIERLTGERHFATATRLPTGNVLVAGGYDSSIAVTRSAWLVRPR